VNHKYLQNAKVFLKISDVDIETVSRINNHEFTMAEVKDLVDLKDEALKLEDKLK